MWRFNGKNIDNEKLKDFYFHILPCLMTNWELMSKKKSHQKSTQNQPMVVPPKWRSAIPTEVM